MTGPRRVLLTADAVGGVWVYALELAQALSSRGVAVELAVLGPAASPAQVLAAAALPGVTLHQTGLPLDWTAPSPAVLAETAAALVKLAQQRNVDLVQLHTPALAGNAVWPAPVLAVLHSCVGTWWQIMRGDIPPPPDFLWRMQAVRAGLATVDAVIAPTQAFALLTQRVYRAQRRIEIVHNGRSLPSPAPAAAATNGVLAAGRLWDEAKNIATLDAAAGLLRGIPVFAAGALRGETGATATLGSITALGSLDEAAMAAAMASARIFAAPALYEPFGLAVLEAAQTGLPLVLADTPGFRELWDGAAFFLPPQDAQAWASGLGELHESPNRCRALGLQARARASNYTAEKFGAAMWDSYCLMLATPARASAA